MSRRRLLLEGTGGLFADERFLVREGRSVVVGRSRSCDVSVTRTRSARRIGWHALEGNAAFRKMSRHHFRISFDDSATIAIRDLSKNGIQLDDSLVEEATLTWDDLTEQAVTLVFGAAEEMTLRALADADDATSDRPSHL